MTLCVHCAGCGGSACLPRQPLLPALQEEEAWHVDKDGTGRGGACPHQCWLVRINSLSSLSPLLSLSLSLSLSLPLSLQLTEGRSHRMSWNPTMLPQSLAGQRELQLFEKSGEFLSTVSTACVTVCACISLGTIFSPGTCSNRGGLFWPL